MSLNREFTKVYSAKYLIGEKIIDNCRKLKTYFESLGFILESDEEKFFANLSNLTTNGFKYDGKISYVSVAELTYPLAMKFSTKYGVMTISVFDFNEFTGINQSFNYCLAVDVVARDLSILHREGNIGIYHKFLVEIFNRIDSEGMIGGLNTICFSYYYHAVSKMLCSELCVPIDNYLHPINIIPIDSLPHNYEELFKQENVYEWFLFKGYVFINLWQNIVVGDHDQYKSLSDKLGLKCLYDLPREHL